jgi:hypothetical protein
MITISKIRDLIRPERLDIGAKLYFLERGLNVETKLFGAEEIYLDSINRLTLGIFEEDGSDKRGKDDYVDAFRDNFFSIKKNGFNEDYAIPIDAGVITGGAHRLSSAIFLGLSSIPTVVSEDVAPPCYDYTFFAARGMKRYGLYCMMRSLLPFNRNMRVAILWPRGRQYEDNLLRKLGPLYYSCALPLSLDGLTHFVSQVYSQEVWTGNYQNGYIGAFNKALDCYRDRQDLKVFVYDRRVAVNDFKSDFREYAAIDKSSLHTTDTFEEARDIITYLISPGIEKVFNSIPRNKTPSYDRFRREIASLPDREMLEAMVFDGGQVLTLLGRRETQDCDYFSYGNDGASPSMNLSAYFDKRSANLSTELDGIHTPVFHYPIFRFDQVNYLRPEIVLELKRKRLQKDGDEKDKVDIKELELLFQVEGAMSKGYPNHEKVFFYYLRVRKKIKRKIVGILRELGVLDIVISIKRKFFSDSRG